MSSCERKFPGFYYFIFTPLSISFRSKNRDKEPSFRIPLFDLIDNIFSSLENIIVNTALDAVRIRQLLT